MQVYGSVRLVKIRSHNFKANSTKKNEVDWRLETVGRKSLHKTVASTFKIGKSTVKLFILYLISVFQYL